MTHAQCGSVPSSAWISCRSRTMEDRGRLAFPREKNQNSSIGAPLQPKCRQKPLPVRCFIPDLFPNVIFAYNSPAVVFTAQSNGGHHEKATTPRPLLLSRSRVSERRDSPQKRVSSAPSAVHASSTAARNCWKNWAATICVPAVPPEDFKNCCMQTGQFDGSDRDDFFQGLTA